MTIYTLFAHGILYKEGMTASFSLYLGPFIAVNAFAHSVE